MSASEIKPEGESQQESTQEFSSRLGQLIQWAAQNGVGPDYVVLELEIQKSYAMDAFKAMLAKRNQAQKSTIIKPIR